MEDMVIMRKEISDLSIDLDGLKLRIKKKIILPKETEKETSLNPDGLDGVRQIL